ncbi:MAG: M48 family metalloprotease [Hyphomicrobiales bacterium]
MPVRIILGALLCAALLGACKTGNMVDSLGDAATFATTLNTSTERQRELGDAAAGELVAQHLHSDDRAFEAYLNTIAVKLARAAGAKDYTYRLYLLDDAQVNAFTPGGGHIFVTTGLVRALKTEAQMAAVIAHEIGHITESHVVRGIRNKKGAQVAAKLGVEAAGLKSAVARAVYDYSISAAINGHGRTFEIEADRLGLDTMVKAGYDPQAAPQVFEVLRRLYGDRSELANFFHGDHPTNQQRIRALTAQIAERYGGVDRSGLIRDTAAYRRFKARYPN